MRRHFGAKDPFSVLVFELVDLPLVTISLCNNARALAGNRSHAEVGSLDRGLSAHILILEVDVLYGKLISFLLLVGHLDSQVTVWGLPRTILVKVHGGLLSELR